MLNLEGVPYIDSAGLGEIVRTYTTVSRQGGNLKLLNLTKRIEDLLSITKLLTVFETYDTEAEADQELQRIAVEAQSLASSTSVTTRGLSGLLISLRPEQWTKNLILFAALIFGQRLFDSAAVGRSVAAFFIFCALVGRRLPDQRRQRPRGRSPCIR